MGLFRNKMASRPGKKTLVISLGKDINDSVLEYCKKANVSLQEIGYSMGRICADTEIESNLSWLLFQYFLAGIYYREEVQDEEFGYQYLTSKQLEKEKDKVSKMAEELLKDLHQPKQKDEPRYIG